MDNIGVCCNLYYIKEMTFEITQCAYSYFID